MGNMEWEEHLREQEVQRTLNKSQQIKLNKHLYRKINCVNKISGYKYVHIFQSIP